VDYAAFGRALMALYDYSDPDTTAYLAAADQLAIEMVQQFADPEQAMRMNADAVGLGPFRPLDDSEIASGNAQALALLNGLDRRLARVGEAAPKLAAALAIDAINSPGQRAAILTALEVFCCGPVGALRVSNGGAVRVFSSVDSGSGALVLTVKMREGWHINAHEPLEDYLIGMELAVSDAPVDQATYPEAEVKELGFSETPLALYEKPFVLTVPLGVVGTGPVRAQLTLQACNDQVCLPPDDMVFWFW
ncbi:protein-disulfide reductase DsbD domain-containing protein, partial [Profundibacter sp.]